MWGFADLEDLTRDLKFAVRRILKQRTFSLSVVGVMAIGIGAVTAMFSAVDAAMLRPLPFKSPEQLMVLPNFSVPFDPGVKRTGGPARRLDVTDVREMKTLFTDVAAFGTGGANLVDAERPIRVKAAAVTTNFLSTLGITPIRGRSFVDAEGVPNGPDVAILSYGLWQRQYGGRDVSGMRIVLGTRTYEVVGVMPRGFTFPSESDVWVPQSVPYTFATSEIFRGFNPSLTLARLAPGVSETTANLQLLAKLDQWNSALDARSAKMYADLVPKARAKGTVHPLQQQLVGDRKTALYVLLGATGLLLLIACVNVTNLLLSQANARRRELAVRLVLGATRGRVVRQLLTESVVLSVAGAALGILLAPIALRTMRALLPSSLDGIAPAELNLRVLIFAVVMALITGIGFGLWPAFRSARESDGDVIKGGGGHGSTTANAGRVRRVLVSAELALTVMLLIGAGLMLRSFSTLMNSDSGMNGAQTGTLEMTLASTATNRGDRVRNLNATLQRLAAMPGIQSVGAINDLPLNGQGGISVTVEIDGAPPLKDDDMRFARYLFASPDYFTAMRIPLLRGRMFSASEDSLSPKTAVISNAMAKLYWPGVDPIGRTFKLGSDAVTVVGIVSDVRESKLEEDGGPQMYLNLLTIAPTRLALVARGNIPEQTLLAYMADAVRSVDKSQAVYNLRMMGDVVSLAVAPRRTNTILIAAFAALALMLASVGVYAVVSYGVAHRSRELGIRSALGATGSSLVTMLASEMVWVGALGIGVGLAGAWALAKTLSNLVYGVEVHDTITFVVVPVALLVPLVLATLVPARRVLKVNPADVMRAD